MKIRALILTVALLASVSPFAMADNLAPAETMQVDAGRGLAPYRVSLNELYFPTEGVRAVDAQPSLQAMRELLAEVIIGAKKNAFLVLYPAGGGSDVRDRVILTDEIVIKGNSAAAAAAAKATGVQNVEPLSFSPVHYKVTVTNPANTLEIAKELQEIPGVEESLPQVSVLAIKHAIPNDPLFAEQWHLLNVGQFRGSVRGMDVNVVPVWDVFRGKGQAIGIVDDGVDLTHVDLVSSINRSLGYDYAEGDSNPSPSIGDYHGTACAGIAAASGFNAIGVAGVAPAADIAPIRLMQSAAPYVSFVTLAGALSHRPNEVGIKSCSFGFSEFVDLGSVVEAAMDNSLRTGRNGKGTVFVCSAGNSAPLQDANHASPGNWPGTITVGAVDDTGKKAFYSESGACLVVVAPSWSRDRPGITTTDITGALGYSGWDYYNSFDGTSASCPMVAGVVALMLEAQPEATWNAVQDVLIRTARKIDDRDGDWITNGAGLHFNHNYGAGLVDAEAAVAAISGRTSFPKQSTTQVAVPALPASIPDNNAEGVTFTIPVTSGIRSLEHVVLKVSAQHPKRSDLNITLTSPSGTQSKLATNKNVSGANLNGWPFLTVRNWGENPNGTWTLKISDASASNQGIITSASLELYGLSRAQPPIVSPGAPVSNVKVEIQEPANLEKMSARSITVKGTAEAPGGIEKVEFQHLMFGTVSGRKNQGNPRISDNSDGGTNIELLNQWSSASGDESWKFSTFLTKGENRIRVRATSKDGSVSLVKVLRIMVP